jgi:hypothetical protein
MAAWCKPRRHFFDARTASWCFNSRTTRNFMKRRTFLSHLNQRREAMPVILLWAVPAFFVLGGVTYLIVK